MLQFHKAKSTNRKFGDMGQTFLEALRLKIGIGPIVLLKFVNLI
ncbi:MAG: hypothetical protein ACYCSW_11390 [bacterium]